MARQNSKIPELLENRGNWFTKPARMERYQCGAWFGVIITQFFIPNGGMDVPGNRPNGGMNDFTNTFNDQLMSTFLQYQISSKDSATVKRPAIKKIKKDNSMTKPRELHDLTALPVM